MPVSRVRSERDERLPEEDRVGAPSQPKAAVDKPVAAPAAKTPAAPPAPPQAPPALTPAVGTVSFSAPAAPPATEFLAEHKVVSGDSLSKIAQHYYGSGAKWQLIYEANREVIGANPNLIRVGQVLKIPHLPQE